MKKSQKKKRRILEEDGQTEGRKIMYILQKVKMLLLLFLLLLLVVLYFPRTLARTSQKSRHSLWEKKKEPAVYVCVTLLACLDPAARRTLPNISSISGCFLIKNSRVRSPTCCALSSPPISLASSMTVSTYRVWICVCIPMRSVWPGKLLLIQPLYVTEDLYALFTTCLCRKGSKGYRICASVNRSIRISYVKLVSTQQEKYNVHRVNIYTYSLASSG